MKRTIVCAMAVAIVALVSDTLTAQGPGFTKGTITGMMGDKLQVAVSQERFWILDLIQPCWWCKEGVSVIMRPNGPVRVTLERDIPGGIRRIERVKAFVIHKSD